MLNKNQLENRKGQKSGPDRFEDSVEYRLRGLARGKKGLKLLNHENGEV